MARRDATIRDSGASATTAPHVPRDYSFLARYGSVISKVGVGTVPSALFVYQGELGLKPDIAWFICVLLSHRWTQDLPYPSLKRISRQTGVGINSLRRYREALEATTWNDRPLLQIVERRRPNGGCSSNAYDLSGLFAALEELILRDRQIWFNSPLAGEDWNPAVAPEDLGAEIAVDNAVDNSPPGYARETGAGFAGAPGAGTSGVGGAGTAKMPGPERHGEPGRVLGANPHEEETWDEEFGCAEAETVESAKRFTTSTKEQRSRAANSKRSASTAFAPSNDLEEDSAPCDEHGVPESSWIDSAVEDYTIELHDDLANTRRNQTQARRIWQTSQFRENTFVNRMARAKRKAQQARVQKTAFDGLPNRMPYFFKVLRDICGID